jgi:hypothetical protein
MKKLITIFGYIGLVIFLSPNASGQISPNSNNTTNTTPYANVYLSNLVSPTTVNQDLLLKTTNYYNLGNSTKTWKGLYVGTINATGNASIGGTFKVTGLINITAGRLALLNKSKNKAAVFNIEDLFDEDGNGCGTKVVLTMPFKDLTEVIA